MRIRARDDATETGLSTAVTPWSWLNHGPDKRSWFSRPRPLPAASALSVDVKGGSAFTKVPIHRKFFKPWLLRRCVHTYVCVHVCVCLRRRRSRRVYRRGTNGVRDLFEILSRGDNKWPAANVPTKRGGPRLKMHARWIVFNSSSHSGEVLSNF